MNVMITSSGRRTTLLKAFKNVANKKESMLIAGDADGLAPTLYLADKAIKLPRLDNPDYAEFLLKVIKDENIKAVIPTIDTELMILNQMRKRIEQLGCTVIVSSEELIQICEDKWNTYKFFKGNNISVPKSWLPSELYDIPEEIFIKPRRGSASKDTYKVSSGKMDLILPLVPDPIIQEYLNYDEITIDALLDLQGNVIHYVPRIRIRTVGGESIQGKTIDDNDIGRWIVDVLTLIVGCGGIGPITIQAFLGPDGPILSEINPRFGGGFPLTLAAGGNYPEWVFQMVEGKKIESKIGEYKRNLFMTRYYSEIFTEETY